MDNRISIYYKNTKTLAILVEGMTNLSVYTPYLTVKRKATDASAVLYKSGLLSDPSATSNTFTFSLTTSDTSLNPADYVYDVTIIGDPSQGNTNVITLVRDRFTIMENVFA